MLFSVSELEECLRVSDIIHVKRGPLLFGCRVNFQLESLEINCDVHCVVWYIVLLFLCRCAQASTSASQTYVYHLLENSKQVGRGKGRVGFPLMAASGAYFFLQGRFFVSRVWQQYMVGGAHTILYCTSFPCPWPDDTDNMYQV